MTTVEIAPHGPRPPIQVRPLPSVDPPYDDELEPQRWATANQLALDWPLPGRTWQPPPTPAAEQLARQVASARVAAGTAGDAKLAVRLFVQMFTEVLNGYRPAGHLARLTVPKEASNVVAEAIAGTTRVTELTTTNIPRQRRPSPSRTPPSTATGTGPGRTPPATGTGNGTGPGRTPPATGNGTGPGRTPPTTGTGPGRTLATSGAGTSRALPAGGAGTGRATSPTGGAARPGGATQDRGSPRAGSAAQNGSVRRAGGERLGGGSTGGGLVGGGGFVQRGGCTQPDSSGGARADRSGRGAAAMRQFPRRGAVDVLKFHFCEPRPGAVESTVLLRTGERTWAMALRMELQGRRWMAAAVRLL